ncbi:hypothetical protein D3C76_450910 [compost metagenome]
MDCDRTGFVVGQHPLEACLPLCRDLGFQGFGGLSEHFGVLLAHPFEGGDLDICRGGRGRLLSSWAVLALLVPAAVVEHQHAVGALLGLAFLGAVVFSAALL